MPTLKEIKGRMGSVASTLKITSAMKLVSSAKLRKAQALAEAMIPYQHALESILADLSSAPSAPSGYGYPSEGKSLPWLSVPSGERAPRPDPSSPGPLPLTRPRVAMPSEGYPYPDGTQRAEGKAEPGYPSESVAARGFVNGRGPRSGRDLLTEGYPGSAEATDAGAVAIVAVASNASLCGGFNANVLRSLIDAVRGWEAAGARVEVYAIGRRLFDASRKAGLPLAPDQPLATLPDRLTYADAASFAESLIESYAAGRYARIDLLWNHFVSTGSQAVTTATFLPLSSAPSGYGYPSEGKSLPWLSVPSGERAPRPDPSSPRSGRDLLSEGYPGSAEGEEYIVEPSREEVMERLMPKVLKLKVYATLLDSLAAEHAARMVAMQTATDNGEDLLQELTLEYNKGRQQKITAEILDLAGGALR